MNNELQWRRDKTQTVLDRITSKAKIVGECYEFHGTTNQAGYGIILVDGKQQRVHRYVYEEMIGSIPDGTLVCHSCDNRRCFRPSHLFLGGHDLNAADRNAKGRQAKGERHGRAKLTPTEVIAIQVDERKHGEIAETYGVSPSYVSRIKAGTAWRHYREEESRALR